MIRPDFAGRWRRAYGSWACATVPQRVVTVVDMLTLFDSKFLSMVLHLVDHGAKGQGAREIMQILGVKFPTKHKDIPVDEAKGWPSDLLDTLAEDARKHGLPMCGKLLEAMSYESQIGALNVAARFPELKNRLIDELGAATLVAINDRHALYLCGANLMGADVAARFPELADEIEGVADCLAVSLGTPAVFHLMRLMEGALRRLAKSLGVSDPAGGDRNWDRMLAAIRKGIDARETWQRGERGPYDVAHSMLNGVRIAWRNECMHLDARYTEADATRILHAVHNFLSELVKIPAL